MNLTHHGYDYVVANSGRAVYDFESLKDILNTAIKIDAYMNMCYNLCADGLRGNICVITPMQVSCFTIKVSNPRGDSRTYVNVKPFIATTTRKYMCEHCQTHEPTATDEHENGVQGRGRRPEDVPDHVRLQVGPGDVVHVHEEERIDEHDGTHGPRLTKTRKALEQPTTASTPTSTSMSDYEPLGGFVAMVLGTKLFPEIAEHHERAHGLGVGLHPGLAPDQGVLHLRRQVPEPDQGRGPRHVDVQPADERRDQALEEVLGHVGVHTQEGRRPRMREQVERLDRMHTRGRGREYGEGDEGRIEEDDDLIEEMLAGRPVRTIYDRRLHVFDNEVVIRPERFLMPMSWGTTAKLYVTENTYVLSDPDTIVPMDSRMIPGLRMSMYQPSFAAVSRNARYETTDIAYIDVIKDPLHVHRLGQKKYPNEGDRTPIGMFEAAPASVLRLTYSVEPDFAAMRKLMRETSGITSSTVE
ncbi:hypothetical protein Asppvi_003442 [Aspergillus pseudoviridinutans]|uniref:Uncharacterized protein n=1 Tax=Aspergillus pseudoviridinutans TaxID=1517512 RepID=A0A9P3ETD5_9EURO|nr:uncharacterized protein Asppvi_003442 [Aspergillus pseudoviridinutans]GIJ84595.1 hypothetical protein Asppvi_003442 [Aspergillus pseudoviridinutans]